ncbi:hypothetical protein BH24PSE2_BH24PSE2_06910 [soil metagenome]
MQKYTSALLLMACLTAGAVGGQETTRPNDPLQPIDPAQPAESPDPAALPEPAQPPEPAAPESSDRLSEPPESTQPNEAPPEPARPRNPAIPDEPVQPDVPRIPPEPAPERPAIPPEPLQPSKPSDPDEAAGQTRGIGHSGRTSQSAIENLTCKEYLVLTPDDVERVYYWYGGFIAGRADAPKWRYANVMEWNDAVVTRCTDSQSERVIDIIGDL